MNKILTLVLAVFSFQVLAVDKPLHGIEVTGKAEVEAVPDVFIAHFTLSEKGNNASKIKLNVDHKSKLIINQARSLGIKDEDITSARISIWSSYEDKSKLGNNVEVINRVGSGEYVKARVPTDTAQNKHLVYHASRRITLKLHNIEGYEKLLDSATKVGVSHVSPLEMQVSQAQALYQQALSLALKNAKQKAENIAKQANRPLGKLIYLKESSYGAPIMHARMDSEMAGGFSPNVGKKGISAQVVATFSME